MGEYIKYKGAEVKIGTLDNLYYTSYQKYQQALKEGQLVGLEGNGLPEDYVNPDLGYRFRFPFPDEDKLPLGDIDKFHFDRGVPIKLKLPNDMEDLEQWQMITGKGEQLEITQQKPIQRKRDRKMSLALVVRNPDSKLSFRIEEEQDIKSIVKGIIHNHIIKSKNMKDKIFYRQLAVRIIEGYHLEKTVKKTQDQSSLKSSHPKRRRRRGRSLG